MIMLGFLVAFALVIIFNIFRLLFRFLGWLFGSSRPSTPRYRGNPIGMWTVSVSDGRGFTFQPKIMASNYDEALAIFRDTYGARRLIGYPKQIG